MALEFLKGVQQPTAQEAVAFVDDGSTGSGEYVQGQVVANVSELVAVDGPEDVVAYVNDAGTSLNLVAEVTVEDGGIVLDVGADGAPADADSVASDGGQFFNVDEAVEANTLDSSNLENGGDLPTGENDTDLVFTWTDADDNTYVEPLTDGIPVVLQASGY